MNDIYEDSSAQIVKNFWAKYGTALLVGVVLAILGVYGIRFWHTQQEKTATQASRLYDDYVMAFNQGNEEMMQASVNTLMDNYQQSPYTSAVTLIQAADKASHDDYEAAETSLQWVIEQGHDYAKPLARLRLAEIKSQQQAYDEALALLSSDTNETYRPAYLELSGDIYLMQGNIAKAVENYTQAMQAYREQGFDNILLQYKLQTYAPEGQHE